MLVGRRVLVAGKGLVVPRLQCYGRVPHRGFLNFFMEQPEKTHSETKVLPFPPEKMFEVVADIEKYKDFLPWCKNSVILSKKENEVQAELTIGFQMFEEKYVSKVVLDEPKSVKVSVKDSPLFHYLVNTWEFLPGVTPNTCLTNFRIVFKLKSQLHTALVEPVFDKVTYTLVSAFEARAKDLQQQQKNKK